MKTLSRSLRKSPAAMFVVVLGCVLALPILIPMAMIGHLVGQRRLRQFAGKFLCASCGKRLGLEAIRLADERWAAEVREWPAKFPGMKMRVVRTLHAICPYCGCEYTYREKENTLVHRSLS